LKGEGAAVEVNGLFDDGAMVNSICNSTFTLLKDTLGELVPSRRTLRMADGTCVPSHGCWSGDVILGGQTVEGSFEVFPSGGGWSLLFGKPLLQEFKAIHNYENDTLMIPFNGEWTTLTNECAEVPIAETSTGGSANVLMGDVESPSRQVLTSILNNTEHVDKQNSLETFIDITDPIYSVTQHKTKRRGRRARSRLNSRDAKKSDFPLRQWWDNIWTVQDATSEREEIGDGDLQPEVELGGDQSLFTRVTDPHNPKRVEEILKQVSIGSDLSDEQRSRVRGLVSKFADCFALSVREVLPIPGAEHRIHIPPNTTFPKKIPRQRQLTEAQRAYLSDAIDELLKADIIESIRPEDVKCVSPITLAQKVHINQGLSPDELRHRVNEECIIHGLPLSHKTDGPVFKTPTPIRNPDMKYDPTQAQKWRICQNYGALNRVTQVFPMPQGDIRTKQRRLSGHRWVHGFDFASGFYAITIPEALRPYLAYYVEGRGFHTQK